MSRREDDEIAAALAEHTEREAAAEARHLGGHEVWRLRNAVEQASKALAQINTKGLPFAHRRDVEAARSALADAASLVKRKAAQSSEGPARNGGAAAG